MTTIPIDEHLHPRQFVVDCRQSGRVAFVSGLRDTLILLLRLERLDTELATTLSGNASGASVPLVPARHDKIGFFTIAKSSPCSPPPCTAVKPRRSPDAVTLGTKVARNHYFVAPLRKRVQDAKPFFDRISVGRAHNNDIVLRDESVSKFHGWFECDEQGTFYVGDGRSRNGTYVNGRAVSDLTRLEPGDSIQFGSVDSLLCTPPAFWDAVFGMELPMSRGRSQ